VTSLSEAMLLNALRMRSNFETYLSCCSNSKMIAFSFVITSSI